MTTPRELVQGWVEAFNARDVERLAAFYTEDAVNHQVAELPVEGREAIRQMFVDGFTRAEMVCIPENIFVDGEWQFWSGAIRWGCADVASSMLPMD